MPEPLIVAWGESAYEKRDGLDYLLFDYDWDPIRVEPRFKDLLKKVSFTSPQK